MEEVAVITGGDKAHDKGVVLPAVDQIQLRGELHDLDISLDANLSPGVLDHIAQVDAGLVLIAP